MDTYIAKIASTKQQKTACVAAICCGLLLTLSGCGIPGLRRARCGPATPSTYNWNNGAAFENHNAASEAVDLAAPVTRNDSQGQDAFPSDGDSGNDSIQYDKAIDDDLHADVPAADDSTRHGDSNEQQSLASFIRAASLSGPVIDDEPEPIGEIQDQDQGVTGQNEVSSGPADGLLNTGLAPIDLDFGLTPIENSAHLPQAAFYSDPFLVGLINETLAGNQELKILAEEIRIAGNEAYARSGEYRPFVTLGAGAGLEKSGRHTRNGAVEEQLEVAPGTEFPDPLGDFLVAADVSWELDIWNRLRNSQRAAAMRYLATQEGRNYIVTRMVAEVAESYYTLLALDNRLQTLQATVEIQQRSLAVARAKKAAGRGTELAVQRFQAEVQKNLSERALIQQEIVEVENRINFLAGRYPQPVERISVEFVNLNLNTLGSGVPSELLQNRADIREAERQVAAAGLDVKVARARFYPSLSLNAGLGWNAFSTGYLFRTPESLIYGLAGELVGPLINKREIKAQYCSANAAQLQAIYNYQQTVLEAHIEVVNQITKVENLRRSIEVKKQQLEALQASVDAANILFQNAEAEYVEVLLAQREMMEAKMHLIEIKQEQLVAVVVAYQALGGGGF